jgi:hypothetical protein
MSGAGGKRPGPGRKRLLPWWTRFKIAVACEEAQYKEALKGVRERHRGRTKEIQLERGNIDKQTRKFASRELALKGRAFFVSSAKIDNLGRHREYPSIRPKAPRGSSIRAEIISRVAKKYGYTLRMVERCWKEHRPTLARLRRDLLLISARNPKGS